MALYKQNISIIGPKNSGKSWMLSSIAPALYLKAHGFEQNLNFSFKGQNSPLNTDLITHNRVPFDLVFKSAKQEWQQQEKQTKPFKRQDIDLYQLRLCEIGLDQISLEETRQQLADAHSLIITLDLDDIVTDPQLEQFYTLIQLISSGACGLFETVFITLTKAEKAFLNFETKALLKALDPLYMGSVIQYYFDKNEELVTLFTALESLIEQTYLYLTSAYGFLKSTGQANYNPLTDKPLIHPFRSKALPQAHRQNQLKQMLDQQDDYIMRGGIYFPKTDGEQDKTLMRSEQNLWLPLLTPDPFLMAANKKITPFCLPFKSLSQPHETFDQISQQSALF